MGKPVEPRWHKGKRRWYAAIGEADSKGRRREKYAPASITEADKAGAWRWLSEAQSKSEMGPSEGLSGPVARVIIIEMAPTAIPDAGAATSTISLPADGWLEGFARSLGLSIDATIDSALRAFAIHLGYPSREETAH